MTEKKYRAVYDDGHDWGELEYWSQYRNNSKANMEDAKEALGKALGWRRADQLTIIQTYVVAWNE